MDYNATSRAAPRPPSNGWSANGSLATLPHAGGPQGNSYPPPFSWEQNEQRVRGLLNEQHVLPVAPE